MPVECSATNGTSVSNTHAKGSESITEKRREESNHHLDMTGFCEHGLRAAVVTCTRSSQTTLQLEKGKDSYPPPPTMTEEPWRVDCFSRGGTIFKGLDPGRATVLK